MTNFRENRDRAIRLVLIAGLWLVVMKAPVACGEHGRFDRTDPDPRDEATIFTPPGSTRPGTVAVAPAESTARLKVTIVDQKSGQPTPCRVNVVGSDGNFYQPQENPLAAYSLNGTWPETLAGNRPGKEPIRYFGHFFYTPGKFIVDVPAGVVRLEVWKGFEYRVEMSTLHVTAGQTRDVAIELVHATPMTPRGWYSGDPHLHFTRASEQDENTIFDLLEAEDIHWGMVLCYNNDTTAYSGAMSTLETPQLRGMGRKSVKQRGAYCIVSGQEYRNVVLGHLNLYLRDRLYLEGAQLDPNVGPLFGQIGQETRAQGGYAFHAHGGYGLEIWADLVQGATAGVELLQFGIYRGIGLDGWYHALNAGLRFPGFGACDYPACRKLGDCRTYVHLDGPPSMEAWLRAAAEGRSFMTSGPLVLLDVDGHLPGDTINTADEQPRRVHAKVRVRSETAPVTNVQLIVNGQIARELTVSREVGTAQWLEVDEPLELSASSWIAARAFSRTATGKADAEAHTNPVFVHLNGQLPFQAADADWLIARLDEQIADHQARSVPEKQVAIDYFRRSREILVAAKERHLAAAHKQVVEPDKAAVESALAEPLLAEHTPLEQMRAFAEPKIVRRAVPADAQAWEAESHRLRQAVLDRVVFRGAAARVWRDAPARVEWLDTIDGGPGYHIRKLRYEALPGMWIPALLYEPTNLKGRVPLVLHFNGHERPLGKATPYKQMLSINLAKRGMLVLDPEWFGMGQLNTPGFSHYRLNQLDLCGASGLAPFYLAMSRLLDLGLALPHADQNRVLATGLSGGGWQTIVISSLDERVTMANPVAGYGGFRTNILCDDMGDSEQAPTDLGLIADYTHLTALRAGQPTLLTYNATDDCCFRSDHTLEPLLDAARPAFALLQAAEKLRSHVNHVPGTHNFEVENREQLYAMIGDFFYAGDATFSRHEIVSTDETKTAEQLQVPLPATNLDFHALAQRLITVVPRPSESAGPAKEQQAHQRRALRALLKIPDYEVTVAHQNAEQQPGLVCTSRRLSCGQDWTIPCIELLPIGATPPRSTVIVIADEGRATTASEVQKLLQSGQRVLALDPLGLGESQVKAQDPAYLYPLFLATVGERALGIQAAQLLAVARWQRKRLPDDPVSITALGPRASMAALVAVASAPDSLQRVELVDALASLKQLVTEDRTVEELPELFAFGLLADFDVPNMAALAGENAVIIRSTKQKPQ